MVGLGTAKSYMEENYGWGQILPGTVETVLLVPSHYSRDQCAVLLTQDGAWGIRYAYEGNMGNKTSCRMAKFKLKIGYFQFFTNNHAE